MQSIHLISEHPIDKKQIVVSARLMRNILGKEAIGKEVARHTLVDGDHHYSFLINRAGEMTEVEIELIISVLCEQIKGDFEVEVDIDLENECTLEDDEVEEISPVVIHETWMVQQIQEGWRFGVEFNEEDKTDPMLKPYYMLSESQRSKVGK